MEFKELEKLEANKQSDEISQMLDLWDKKISEADELLQTVENNLSGVTKEIVVMRNDLSNKRQEQIDLENIKRKGLFTLRQLRTEKEQITRSYWRAK